MWSLIPPYLLFLGHTVYNLQITVFVQHQDQDLGQNILECCCKAVCDLYTVYCIKIKLMRKYT